MSLDEFQTSDGPNQGSEDTAESEFRNCRIEPLSDTDSLDTPDFISVWVSDNGLTVMMEVPPNHFRKNVSAEVKERAKETGIIFLDSTSDDPVIVLTDDPEEYGTLLETFGLEDFLRKRIQGEI